MAFSLMAFLFRLGINNMISCHIFDNYLSIAIMSLNIILIGTVPSELKLVNVVSTYLDNIIDN